jgi:hypothetical protein
MVLLISVASDKALLEDLNRAEKQRNELFMERKAPLEDHKLRMKKVVHRLNKLEKPHNRTLDRMIKTFENSEKKIERSCSQIMRQLSSVRSLLPERNERSS